MAEKFLYLIDATAFCYRAFYALRGLATSSGEPTNAIYGFLNMFYKILKDKKPEYLAVCFDISRHTFRQEKFQQYKIHRPPMPDDLAWQIPFIKQIIAAYGISLFEKEGYEADDIIASLSRSAAGSGFNTVIISSDKDILQLVDGKTTVLNPGKNEETIYTQDEVKERFGVGPERIPDIIALMGDSTDNIPGVPGIGEKTAAGLLREFGSLENLLKNINSVKHEKIKSLLKEHVKQARMCKELAALDSSIAFDIDWDELKVREPHTAELIPLFKRFEFKKLLNEITPGLDTRETDLPLRDDSSLEEFGRPGSFELVLALEPSGNLLARREKELFRFCPEGEHARRLLASDSVKKIGHDLKVLKVHLAGRGLRLGGIFFDSMLAAYVLNPGHGSYSLPDLSWEYISQEFKGSDATVHIQQLKDALTERLKAAALWELFSTVEMPLIDVLSEMEITGIHLDEGFLKKLSEHLAKRLEKLIKEIYSICGCTFNINSPKQLREVLFVKLKLPVVKKTKSGPSTDEEVLRALADEHRLPGMLLVYRQLTKLKSTYVDALPALIDKKTARLHTSFNQTATETGRLSSSNPNLQNIPVKTEDGRQIRKALISSGETWELISCDYSQIELRVLAHLSDDSGLCAAFRNNKDIHKATAALIYGVDEDEVTVEMRDTAKRVNFGIIYGLTSYGLSRDLKIPVQEAQNFIDAYFLRYPGVRRYIDAQIESAQQAGFVTTLLGRRRYIPQINNKNINIKQFAQRQAVNTPVQGTAADLIKLAMLKIHDEFKRRGVKSRMVLQVHDELVFDSPKSEISSIIPLARRTMEGVCALKVPVKVDIKRGSNWLEMTEVE